MKPRILIAGVGNIFLGDDAFGCEVTQRLLQQEWPHDVKIFDYGIRGFDLAYALLEDYEAVVLVDAVPRGDEPGTLYLIEPELKSLHENDAEDVFVEAHCMNLKKVFAMVKSMEGAPRRIFLVGCEPSTSCDEERMGLSAPVAAAVDGAVEMVRNVVDQFRKGDKTWTAGV